MNKLAIINGCRKIQVKDSILWNLKHNFINYKFYYEEYKMMNNKYLIMINNFK